MMTWRLWRAFKHPPIHHPLYHRMMLAAYPEKIELFSLLQRILIQGQTWLWPLVFMVNMRALLLMVFSGTLYGILWTLQISGAIAEERSHRRYDLLCLSLAGEIGTVWAICTGCLHQHRAFQQVNSQEAWSVRLILFIPMAIAAPAILQQLFSMTVTASFSGIFALVLIFYLDHVQSILFGVLVGTLVSHYTAHPYNQRLWAVTGFMSLQMVSYLFLAAINFWILPLFYHPAVTWYGDVGAAVLNVLVFYLLREILLNRLWAVVVKQIAGHADEFASLFERSQERTTGGYADAQAMARTP